MVATTVEGVVSMTSATIRLRVVAGLCVGLVTVLGSACSGSSTPASGERLGPKGLPKACDLFGKLDAAAVEVKSADPKDPEAFAKAVDAGVHSYVTALDGLRKELPSDLQAKIDEIKVMVEAHDFTAAIAARAPFDDWVVENC